MKRAEKAKLGVPGVTSHMNSNVKSGGGAHTPDTFPCQIFKKIPGAPKLLHVNGLDGYQSARSGRQQSTQDYRGDTVRKMRPFAQMCMRL